MSHSLNQVATQDRTRREILHRSDHIPPLPENVTGLLSLLDKPDTEPEDLEGLVRKDQVLVAKLLRLVNSPLYGLSREMTSIRDATMVLGFRGLRSMVLASCTAQHLKRNYSVFGFPGDGLWKHSLAVAVLARSLARHLRLSQDKQEELFIAGLLHDIGKLVLVTYASDARTGRPERMPTEEWEKQLCGIDHAEAAKIVAQKWALPPNIVNLLANHHAAAGSADSLELVVLRVADGFAHSQRVGLADDHQTEHQVETQDLATLGLGDVWAPLADDLKVTVQQALSDMQAI